MAAPQADDLGANASPCVTPTPIITDQMPVNRSPSAHGRRFPGTGATLRIELPVPLAARVRETGLCTCERGHPYTHRSRPSICTSPARTRKVAATGTIPGDHAALSRVSPGTLVHGCWPGLDGSARFGPVIPRILATTDAGRAPLAGDVIGRESELAILHRFLDSIPIGPSALVLSGDPGIGKTTVWKEGLAGAQLRRYRTLSCSPVEAETRLSYAALGDLLEPILEEALPTVPEPQRRPSRWPSCASRDRAPEPTSEPFPWPCLDASDRWPPPLRS